MIDEVIDFVVDGFVYIFTFEWFGDFWEFLGSMFENLGEFSITGLIFGILTFGFTFILRDYVLMPFLLHMGRIEYLFWMIATYLSCFVTGYLLGKHFENT